MQRPSASGPINATYGNKQAINQPTCPARCHQDLKPSPNCATAPLTCHVSFSSSIPLLATSASTFKFPLAKGRYPEGIWVENLLGTGVPAFSDAEDRGLSASAARPSLGLGSS